MEQPDSQFLGERLEGIRLTSPFVLRTVSPPAEALAGRRVTGCSRLAKRLVIALEDEFYLVIHLMVAGRLRWRSPGAAVPKRSGLAALDFASGTLVVSEASRKRRASLRLVHGPGALTEWDSWRYGPLLLRSVVDEMDSWNARAGISVHSARSTGGSETSPRP